MRRGYYHGLNKIPVITGEDGSFIGFGLGADYCAEHEWGIDKLRAAFGCSRDPMAFGIPRRRGTAAAPGIARVIYFEFTAKKVKQAILAYDGYSRGVDDERRQEYLKGSSELQLRDWFNKADREAGKHKEPQVAGAWSDSDFGIRVSGKENIANLKLLHDAIKAGDICLFMGGGMAALDNPGLCVAMASRIPESVGKLWYDADMDRHNLERAAVATGIEARLTAAGKRWYALSPRWSDSTKSGVVFWLNPMEQQKYNYGSFTVEELDLWAKDQGPVIMKPKVTP